MKIDDIIGQLESIAENSATMTEESGDIWDNDVNVCNGISAILRLLQVNENVELKGKCYLNLLEDLVNRYEKT